MLEKVNCIIEKVNCILEKINCILEKYIQIYFLSEYSKATQPGLQQGTWDTTSKQNIEIQLQWKTN